jgi:predicted site-specific integrase-resolvase
VNNKYSVILTLYSLISEKADPLVKFAHRIILRKFHTQALESMCRTTMDTIKVLETISAEAKKIKILVKDITELEILDMLRIENNW